MVPRGAQIATPGGPASTSVDAANAAPLASQGALETVKAGAVIDRTLHPATG